MTQFLDRYNTLLENIHPSMELMPDTTFEEIKEAGSIICYHSSDKEDLNPVRDGIHLGTKDQAVWRADYMVNDDQLFDEYNLHKVLLNVGRVYPDLIEDPGTDHGEEYKSELSAEYDTLVYINKAEGDSSKHLNLSLIALNTSNIKAVKFDSVLTSDALDAYING